MKLTTLALILALALPAHAGGPVIVEDRYDVTEPAPRNDWIVPVIIGGLILCAIACDGGGDDAAPEPVKPVCYSEGC